MTLNVILRRLNEFGSSGVTYTLMWLMLETHTVSHKNVAQEYTFRQCTIYRNILQKY